AGVDSVPLVGLVSFFLGLTMALLTGYQLQRFGTERLIPGLVAISFTRELGPLLTGIMLAARIGAAFTAELGTMRVSEEVEAIEAMGIGPLRFLVAPRLLALFFLMPCLSTIANVAAILPVVSSLALISASLSFFSLWAAHWRNRLLPRSERKGWGGRSWHGNYFECGHGHRHGDRF